MHDSLWTWDCWRSRRGASSEEDDSNNEEEEEAAEGENGVDNEENKEEQKVEQQEYMEEEEPVAMCNLQRNRRIVSSGDEWNNEEIDSKIQEGVEQQEAKEAAEQQEIVDVEKGVDNEQSKEEVSEEQEVEDSGEVPDNKDGDGTTKYLWKLWMKRKVWIMSKAKRKYLKNRKLRMVVKFQTIRTGIEQLSTYGKLR